MPDYQPKTFRVVIPLRAKAVQSARFANGHSYVDPKVKAWKKEVSRYVEEAKKAGIISMPCEVVKAIYTFALPKSLTKKAKKAIDETWSKGEDVCYLSPPDLDSNANKGLSDVLTACGVWLDDKFLWRVAEGAVVKKVYGEKDQIELEIRETPFAMMSNGKTVYENYTTGTV